MQAHNPIAKSQQALDLCFPRSCSCSHSTGNYMLGPFLTNSGFTLTASLYWYMPGLCGTSLWRTLRLSCSSATVCHTADCAEWSTRCSTYLCIPGWPGSVGGSQEHTTAAAPAPASAAAVPACTGPPAAAFACVLAGASAWVPAAVTIGVCWGCWVTLQRRCCRGPGAAPRPRIWRCMARNSRCLCKGLSTCDRITKIKDTLV